MRSRVGGEKRAAVGVPADHQVEPRLGVFRVSEKFEDEIFGRERSFGKIVLISPSVENTEASKKFRPRKTRKDPESFFGEKSRERRGEAAFLPLF